MTKDQEAFINSISQVTKDINSNLLKDRDKLIDLHDTWKKNNDLSKRQSDWLGQLASSYKVEKKYDFHKEIFWQQLMSRVDQLPVSLVTAQSAIESAWGQSRFAKEG